MAEARRILLPLAALLSVGAALGLIAGLRAVPPGETEIITAQAARYVAETGGELTDCFARPSTLDGVRLVVICGAADTPVWAQAVDRMGRPVAVDPDAVGKGGNT